MKPSRIQQLCKNLQFFFKCSCYNILLKFSYFIVVCYVRLVQSLKVLAIDSPKKIQMQHTEIFHVLYK